MQTGYMPAGYPAGYQQYQYATPAAAAAPQQYRMVPPQGQWPIPNAGPQPNATPLMYATMPQFQTQ